MHILVQVNGSRSLTSTRVLVHVGVIIRVHAILGVNFRRRKSSSTHSVWYVVKLLDTQLKILVQYWFILLTQLAPQRRTVVGNRWQASVLCCSFRMISTTDSILSVLISEENLLFPQNIACREALRNMLSSIKIHIVCLLLCGSYRWPRSWPVYVVYPCCNGRGCQSIFGNQGVSCSL